jgi:hypothetical protein
MSVSLDLINQTGLVPQTLLGLSSINQSIKINSTDGIVFNDATINQTASLSWNGIITDKPTGFDILSKLNMNSQNIDNVNTITATSFSGLATNATNIQVNNTTANSSYFLTFADTNTTGLKLLQATAGLSLNPSTNTLFVSKNLYVGNATYDANLCCIFNANTNPPSSLTGLVHYPFVFVGKDGERARLTIDSYSSGTLGSILTFRSAGGTAAAPTATTANYQMANLSVQGYTNAGARGAGITFAFLLANATAEWSSSVQSFYTTILTGTANGTATTSRQRWYDDGGIQLGGTVAMSATSPGAGITLVSGALKATQGIELPTSINTATFASGTLTITGLLTSSLRNYNIAFTGTTNTITTLALTSIPLNAEYYVAIHNGGSGTLTFNTGLGAGIKTTYSSAFTTGSGVSVIMKINYIPFTTGGNIYVVSLNNLTT